nr:pentapeptide repeat-containing protein [Moritella viscosa]SHO03621.1 Pentapeptide repeat protein [Moritella viscosa]
MNKTVVVNGHTIEIGREIDVTEFLRLYRLGLKNFSTFTFKPNQTIRELMIHNVTFGNVSFNMMNFVNCKFIHCSFNSSKFNNIHFLSNQFEKCDFKSAIFKNVVFQKVDLVGGSIEFAKFKQSIFVETHFIDNVESNGAYFNYCDLSKIVMTSLSFKNVSVYGSALSSMIKDKAKLENAIFTDEETYVDKTKQMDFVNYSETIIR